METGPSQPGGRSEMDAIVRTKPACCGGAGGRTSAHAIGELEQYAPVWFPERQRLQPSRAYWLHIFWKLPLMTSQALQWAIPCTWGP